MYRLPTFFYEFGPMRPLLREGIKNTYALILRNRVVIDLELLVVEKVRCVDGLNILAISLGFLFLFLEFEKAEDADQNDEHDAAEDAAHDQAQSPRQDGAYE